jgi:lipoprotein signal peptidase
MSKKTLDTKWFNVFLFVFLIALDQVTKYFARPVFYNDQFAFSLPVPIWLMYGLYLFFISTMLTFVYRHFKQFTTWQILGWLLIFAGAFSNIGERIYLGYVRDWIYILNGVFNLADGYIICGIIILLFSKSFDKN